MAAQYSNRHFFRKIPNQFLAQYFELKNVALDIDLQELKESDADTLQEALNRLDSKQVADIEAEFQEVNTLACEGGITALVDEAGFYPDNEFVEAIAAIEGFHAKAMWAFINKPDYWRGAAMFLHADNVSPSYWKKRNDFPNLPPCVEDEDIQELAKSISGYFFKKEGRGKNCTVEPYRRNQREYFFAYPEDFAQTAIEWEGNSLKSLARHPAFEIIFVYCEAEGSLDIYAPKNPKAVAELQAMFAKHILKLNVLPEGKIDKRIYELNPVVKNDFEFTVEPSSGIASVLVAKLRVTLNQDRKQRIKYDYLVLLKEARQRDQKSVDATAAALDRFDKYNKCQDFKRFNYQQAIGFKKSLQKEKNQNTGKPLSKATLNSTLRHIKAFFQWLAEQQGFRSSIVASDAEYFNLSEKDVRTATASRPKRAPTIQQVKHVISLMPFDSDIEKRNRALMAFILLTGARDKSVASLQLKHIDLVSDSVFFDAREVDTKFSKTFTTYFFPVGDEVRDIVADWVAYLRDELLFGIDAPLFPKTKLGKGKENVFEAQGLTREHWKTTTPIREVFKQAFNDAGLIYYNPHSFRHLLSAMAQKTCKTVEEFKAWSQNLGHEGVLTTLYSYGEVQLERQGELMDGLKP